MADLRSQSKRPVAIREPPMPAHTQPGWNRTVGCSPVGCSPEGACLLEAHAASARDEIHLRACGQLESSRKRFSGEGRRQRLIGAVGAKKLQGKYVLRRLSVEHFGKPGVPLQKAKVVVGWHKAGLESKP